MRPWVVLLLTACRLNFDEVTPVGDAPLARCTPSFTNTSIEAGLMPRVGVLGDFDKDGKLDLAATAGDGGELGIMHGNGDGTFTGRAVYPTGVHPWSLETGDLDGDGKLDIVVGYYDDNKLGVYINEGDGTFKLPVLYAAFANPQGLAIADIDGNGKLDVVATAYTSNKLAVFLGNGDGTLAAPLAVPCGEGPYDVEIADVTGDGKPDLVIAETLSRTAGVLKNLGGGMFAPHVGFATGMQPYSISAGDVDRDGKIDLAIANNYGDGSVSVLVGNGDGTFKPRVDYTVGPRDMGSAWWVEIADLDRSGAADIAVASGDTNSVAILLNKGDGTFEDVRTFPGGNNPGSLVVGDIDRDARMDIITTTLGATNATILHSTCM